MNRVQKSLFLPMYRPYRESRVTNRDTNVNAIKVHITCGESPVKGLNLLAFKPKGTSELSSSCRKTQVH